MKEKQVKLPGPDHPISILRSWGELAFRMQARKPIGSPDDVADAFCFWVQLSNDIRTLVHQNWEGL
jgi:hypothetical protein